MNSLKVGKRFLEVGKRFLKVGKRFSGQGEGGSVLSSEEQQTCVILSRECMSVGCVLGEDQDEAFWI